MLSIIPDFETPNTHYSFSFKPRYLLFIIQLPPPIVITVHVYKVLDTIQTNKKSLNK